MRRFFQSEPTATPPKSAVWAIALILLGLGLDILLSLLALSEWVAPQTLGIIGLVLQLSLAAGIALLFRSFLQWRRAARARRDDEFSELSRRLDLALEASQIGFWHVDLETDRLRWDPRACQLMGVPQKGGYFTEADWLGAVHPDDRTRAGKAAQRAIATGGKFISDYRVVWPSGEVRHLRDMAAFYRGSDGSPRLAGLVWDVTADKETQAALEAHRRQAEAANAAKSSFLAAMSHEIRTPLAGVIGMLDLMLADAPDEEQAERARVAHASAHSLLRLLNDVLDLSKLEAAAMTLLPAPVDPRHLIAEVSSLMAARARQKKLAFRHDVDADVPDWVSVDPVRVRQVLTNIVSNAVSYTHEGHVSLRVSYADGRLSFAVSDTGIGIAEADCERIFDRFVQADSSTSRPSGGTGLGLAISRELVQLMGGQIDVESTPDEGSTFTFWVDAPPCAAPAATTRPPAPRHADTRPLRVLVAEDNATNRFLINSLLKRAGHHATLVRNGREAVDAARGGGFDAILMDIQMPVMDGLTAAQEIRALGSTAAEVPIVALTASVLADERARYEDAGMSACLAKPIDVDLLGRVLADVAQAGRSEPSFPPPQDRRRESRAEPAR